MTSPWLPPDFCHPRHVDLPSGDHMRPIRADDVDIDYPAVMDSRDRLWSKYGVAWGWPPASMTREEDGADLARHEREIAAHQSFNYAVLNADESRLLGCVYLDPPPAAGVDADVLVSWWVIDDKAGTPLERALGTFIPMWVVTAWPFSGPRFEP